MRRLLLSILLTLFAGGGILASELNIYASGLRVNSCVKATNQVTIDYFLNAPATNLELVVIDASTGLGVDTITVPAGTSSVNYDAGSHSAIAVDLKDIPAGTYKWALIATNSTANVSVTKISDSSEKFILYAPKGVVVNNYPETDAFGTIYVSMPADGQGDGLTATSRAQKQGIFVWNPKLDLINTSNSGYKGDLTWQTDNAYGAYRLKVAANGDLYMGASHSSVHNLYKISADYTHFEPLLGHSPKVSGFEMVGDQIYALENTGYDKENSKCVGNLIQYDVDDLPVSEVGTTYATAETTKTTTDNTSLESDGRGGFWIGQYRYYEAANASGYPILVHLSTAKTIDWSSYSASLGLSQSTRGAMAVSPDKNRLAICTGAAGSKKIYIYSITWPTSTPSLSKVAETGVIGNNVDGVAFDYAGNLYAVNSGTELLYVWALPKSPNTCTTPAASTRTIELSTQVTGVSLDETSSTIPVGKSITLTPTVSPATATDKSCTWTSSNTSVATVDENGVVKAIAPGSATITVTTTNRGETATCDVTVSAMAGTYNIGGENAHFDHLSDACSEICTHSISGNVVLLICDDLAETSNSGIINDTEYSITIKPNAATKRTITFGDSPDNVGPSGHIMIGNNLLKWPSDRTQKVIIDGSYNDEGQYLEFQAGSEGGVLVVFYGYVTDSEVKNCRLINSRIISEKPNYVAHFRTAQLVAGSSDKLADANKTDLAPDSVGFVNCYMEVSGTVNTQAISYSGAASKTSAGKPTDCYLHNCEIVSGLRGIFFNGAIGASIEGNTFRIVDGRAGFLSHGIMGNSQSGTITVSGNKFLELSTLNTTALSYGIHGITASGGGTWVIKNNYFAGLNAKASSNNDYTLEYIYCDGSHNISQNTFYLPPLTNTPGTALTSTNPITCVHIFSGSPTIQNNIFVSDETVAHNSLIRGALNANISHNVFYHAGGNAAIVAGDPTYTTFADLPSSYRASNIDQQVAFSSSYYISDTYKYSTKLAAAQVGSITEDIEGHTRHNPTTVGCYEHNDWSKILTTGLQPIWSIPGSMNEWNTGANKITNVTPSVGDMTSGYLDTILPANTEYAFKMYNASNSNWLGHAGAVTQITYANQDTPVTLNNVNQENDNQTFKTAGAGTYRFTWNFDDHNITITYPTSYTVTYGKVVEDDRSVGSISSVTGDDGVSLTSGDYVAKGSATFTASAADYHHVVWRTSSTFGEGVKLSTDNPYTMTSIAADTAVYAQYAKNRCTVTITTNDNAGGSVTVAEEDFDWGNTVDVDYYSSKAIVATPAAGYYFTGWTLSATPDFSVASTSAASTTLSGLGGTHGSTGTLTANFAEDNKIYFDNTYTQWSTVWVYLFSDNCWYDEQSYGKGPGVAPTVNSVAYAQMTKVPGEDNLYQYSYHSSAHNYTFSHVAFCKDDQHDYGAFSATECAYRSDWCANLPVYVAPRGYETVNISANYHSGGYWRAYNPKAGESVYYYLDRFYGTASFDDDQYFKASGDGSLVAEISARLTDADTDYKFGVHSDAGGSNDQHYAEGTKITVDNSDSYFKLYKYNSNYDISLHSTVEGVYTFILSMEYDSLRFSVIYPASVGDYRLTYSYGSPTKTRSSDIIKKKVADAGAVHTSMYVDPTDANAQLLVERCTSITAGVPTWTAKTTFNNSYLNTNFKQNSVATKDVYEMDLTIAGTEGDASTLSNIQKYTGPFYIKTDRATGGWADYTRNVMEQNTINFSTADSKTFDYYYIEYVSEARKKYGTSGWDACDLFTNAGTPTNLKCVIANKYNNSISDTLKTDAVISGGNSYETLPQPGSVRFSYNSSTNEVKRTYLNGSTCWQDAYLLLTADQDIKTLADESIADNATTFDDKNNWVYEKKLKVPETTKIWLKATFDNTPQDLIGTSSSYQQLIGGSSTSNYQTIRIVYDFKTNHLMAAWEPDQTPYNGGEAIDLSSDVLLIHNRRTTTAAAAAVGAGYASSADCQIDSVTMINITADNTAFTKIGKVYSAFRFQKTSANNILGLKTNDAGSEVTALTSAESYYRFNYWISFPYDVKMTDIFGIDGYGSKWRIQYYDGAERATKGWYKGDGVSSFWKTMPMNEDAQLNKGEGYVLQLSPSAFRNASMWQNSATERYLYFPSGAGLDEIEYATSSITLSSLPCTKGLFTDPTQAAAGYSHNITDSHWHVFGIPTFFEASGTTGSGHNYYDGVDDGDAPEDHGISDEDFYFYRYNNDGSTYNTYTATSSSGFTFQPMHAYMIQMTGTLNFTKNSVPASVAARKYAETNHYAIRLDLLSDNVVRDRTFITLRDSAAADFALNEDLMKIHNDGKNNIYSFAGPYDVAANILPVESRIVTLGIETAANSTYTFHMPSNFSGTVTLFDNVENTRTNLAVEDYVVTLPKGTYNERFYLELDVNKVTTDVDDITDGGESFVEIRKFIYDNKLYIMKNGVVYDACGKRVKSWNR